MSQLNIHIRFCRSLLITIDWWVAKCHARNVMKAVKKVRKTQLGTHQLIKVRIPIINYLCLVCADHSVQQWVQGTQDNQSVSVSLTVMNLKEQMDAVMILLWIPSMKARISKWKEEEKISLDGSVSQEEAGKVSENHKPMELLTLEWNIFFWWHKVPNWTNGKLLSSASYLQWASSVEESSFGSVGGRSNLYKTASSWCLNHLKQQYRDKC